MKVVNLFEQMSGEERPDAVTFVGNHLGRPIRAVNYGVTEIENGFEWMRITVHPDLWNVDDVVQSIVSAGVVPGMNEARTIAEALDGDSLDFIKKVMLFAIDRYDKSDSVNGFRVGGKLMWLDKATRVGLANSISIEETAGRDFTRLWFGGMEYTIAIAYAKQMLAAIELYALDCYNVTASHRAKVSALQTVDEVLAYGYTAAYPEQLVFLLSDGE